MPNQQKPLEGRDARIATAIVWAKRFVCEASQARMGLAHELPRAGAQLVAAIEQIGGEPPEERCKCGANRFMHCGSDGVGKCVLSGCTCQAFDPVTK